MGTAVAQVPGSLRRLGGDAFCVPSLFVTTNSGVYFGDVLTDCFFCFCGSHWTPIFMRRCCA